MLTIVILNITVVLLAFFAQFKNSRWLLGLAFIMLSVVLGIRYGLGNDYFGYYDTFKTSFGPISNYNKEIGWFLINKFFHPIGFMGMVFVLTCFEHFLLYKIVKRHIPPRWYWFALFIYVFYYNYMLIGCTMMRQFLAMLIGLYAMESVGEKKWIRYILLSLFAFFIHKSSAALLLVIIVPELLKIVGKKFFFIGLAIVLVGVVSKAELIYEYVVNYLLINSDVNAFQEYFTSKNFEGVEGIGIRQSVIIILFFLLLFRNFDFISEKEKPYCLSVMISFFIIPFTFFLSIIVRLTWYFSIAEIVCYPLVVDKEKNFLLKHIAVMVYIVFTLWSFLGFFTGETYGDYFIEFKTIFSAPNFI